MSGYSFKPSRHAGQAKRSLPRSGMALAAACILASAPMAPVAARVETPAKPRSPTDLLQRHPQGGAGLARAVTAFLLAGPAGIGPLLATVRQAASGQQAAIAQGIACAVEALRDVDAAASTAVSRAAAGWDDEGFKDLLERSWCAWEAAGIAAAPASDPAGRLPYPIALGGGHAPAASIVSPSRP
jgi:hypothetical protein